MIYLKLYHISVASRTAVFSQFCRCLAVTHCLWTCWWVVKICSWRRITATTQ